ncbi:MAG: GntR family transcriptional regulator [Lautropia sp.]
MSDQRSGIVEDVVSSLPIYRRVYAVLREEIRDGIYLRNSLLPSEGALAERFMTSRITIRKALELLKLGGYTTTRHGVGTYALARPVDSSTHHFTSNLDILWQETATELLEYKMVPAPPYVAEPMDTAAGALIHKAIRLRTYREQPLELLTTFIREDVARAISREMFLSGPLSDVFRRVGAPSVTARQRITARSADPFTATHLGIEIGAPVLCSIRVSRDAEGRPISYLRELFRPDRYEFELDLEVDGPVMRAVWNKSDLSNDRID